MFVCTCKTSYGEFIRSDVNIWNSGPKLQPHTHLTVAQDALSGTYKAESSAG